jgi:hypothetical protein
MPNVAKMFRFLGDTVEEVARKLVDQGYPPETAVRIADGTLPMDYASRMQRAMDQGYDIDNPQAHGTSSDFTEFTPSTVGHLGGGGVYTTPDLESASKRGLLMKFRKDLNPNASPNTVPVLVKNANTLDFYSSEVPRDIDPSFVQSQGYDAIRRLDENNKVIEQINYGNDAQRSLLSAAFDPDYKGSNILGGSAGLGILGGLLADYEEEERKRGLLDGL